MEKWENYMRISQVFEGFLFAAGKHSVYPVNSYSENFHRFSLDQVILSFEDIVLNLLYHF